MDEVHTHNDYYVRCRSGKSSAMPSTKDEVGTG